MAYVYPIAFFDPPQILNTVVTPIPASSNLPLQVIANTGINLGVGVNYNDTTGQFIGVYIGLIGQETLACIIGNGTSGQAWAKIPPYSRVSLRAMTNSSINVGFIQAVVVTI